MASFSCATGQASSKAIVAYVGAVGKVANDTREESTSSASIRAYHKEIHQHTLRMLLSHWFLAPDVLDIWPLALRSVRQHSRCRADHQA